MLEVGFGLGDQDGVIASALEHQVEHPCVRLLGRLPAIFLTIDFSISVAVPLFSFACASLIFLPAKLQRESHTQAG
jgi:hypothetical protein